jgi:hypothetical protein
LHNFYNNNLIFIRDGFDNLHVEFRQDTRDAKHHQQYIVRHISRKIEKEEKEK